VQPDLERFLALVRRELGAEQALLLEPDEAQEGPSDEHELRCPIKGGRWIAARFEAPPEGREAKQRRLEMLASTFTFDEVVAEAERGRRSRPPLARSLQDELEALRERAAAVNAVVIDANSPVVWGAARPDGVMAEGPLATSSQTAARPDVTPSGDGPVVVASRRALHAVRSLGELAALHKGKHVRHVANAGEAPLLARSFAGIYLLVLVFEAPFDELRAERAMAESLLRIERLVLALPPLNPPPSAGAGVVAMRRPRRR
jgi:hypothetical protein